MLNKVRRYSDITGYEKDTTSISARVSDIEFTNPSNSWKRVNKRLSAMFRNIRTWVMGEQFTLQYSNRSVETASAGVNYKTWTDAAGAAGTVTYQIKNQHTFGTTYTYFKAPQTADYLVTVYSLIAFSGVTALDKYMQTVICTKPSGGLTNVPFGVAGGGNEPCDNGSNTRIETNGSVLVRMNRNDELKVGWNNISADGGAIQSPDVTGMELKVSIAKVKFYPEI